MVDTPNRGTIENDDATNARRSPRQREDALDVNAAMRDDVELLDIYDPAQRDQLLRDDEISAEEAAFMDGREQTFSATSLRQTAHRDTVSIALAEEEYKGERSE